MNKKFWLYLIFTVIFLTLLIACTQSTPSPSSTTPEEMLIIEKCGTCHSTDRVFQADYSSDEWVEVFDDMINKGAEVNEDEQTIMIDWLVSQKQ